ncbi:MAG: energy-coupling factor transporter transmembrane protein EcfT [Oscillospiraceae bacterium]|jgi:energy-coupling factor transport system permease protein|nr:energy-coupling factor transporter transmembrane protein EcfT [Oscillospiraceae bacterium]
MKCMPAGQFIPGSSIIHRLDARAKLLCFFALLAAVVATSQVWGYVCIFCVIAAILLLAWLPVSISLTSVRQLWAFFIVIFCMNALFFDAAHPLWSWWIFRPSAEGMVQGASVALRVALVLLLSNALTCTTAPMDITSALESLMKPLQLLRVPVEEIAMIISAAIQFIPTLAEETEQIRKAQTARGARFESKKLTEKAASILPLVIPIFLSAFRRADELSLAMEARGYRSARYRTKKETHPLHRPDFAALAASGAVCFLQFCILG